MLGRNSILSEVGIDGSELPYDITKVTAQDTEEVDSEKELNPEALRIIGLTAADFGE